MKPSPKSYEEFWPYYLAQHRHPVSRTLHVLGTTLALFCLALSVFIDLRWIIVAPIVGYGLAWTGHVVFEKNKPATFGHPLWSLRADFRMWRLILTGRKMQASEQNRP
ncbi:MAG: DUF962 domain-containing protein [Myxococcales bacterium]|nr:MAG: DUF962 domain-containing protein [Myxococcales bacterium]